LRKWDCAQTDTSSNPGAPDLSAENSNPSRNITAWSLLLLARRRIHQLQNGFVHLVKSLARASVQSCNGLLDSIQLTSQLAVIGKQLSGLYEYRRCHHGTVLGEIQRTFP
jgi:hypothetical protein